MSKQIYVTHELVMEANRYYSKRKMKNYKKDFDDIISITQSALGKFYIVKGIVHLFGYKVDKEGVKGGFFDVENQEFYSDNAIKDAILINLDQKAKLTQKKSKRLRKRKTYFPNNV